MSTYTWAVVIALLFSGAMVRAQNIDSLKKELTKTTSVEAQSGILYAIGKGYFYKEQFDTSISWFKRSAQAARRAGYDTMYMEACGFLSDAFRDGIGARYDDALLYSDTAIVYARRLHLPIRLEDFLVEKCSALILLNRTAEFAVPIREALGIAQAAHNKVEEARIYKVLAIYYDVLTNYALELDYINQAIDIYASLKMYRQIADGYKFIAINFNRQKKWLESLHYAGIADSIYATQSRNFERNTMKMSMANSYKNLGDLRRAIDLYSQCLDSFSDDDFEKMLTYSNLGVVISMNGSYGEARGLFEKALQLNRKFKLPVYDVETYEELSRACLRVKLFDSALYYALQSERICKNNSIDLPTYMVCVLLMRDVHEARNEMSAAHAYDKHYIGLQDSMYRGILRNNVADAEARFNLGEKKKEVLALSAENELQKVAAQKQALLNISLLVGLCLGGLIVILVITAYRRTLKQNRLLAQQKQVLQEQKDIIDAQVIQLASASKMKSKFLANISHELRTPVTLLNGMLEIMSDGKKQEQTKDKERLDIAYNNSRKLQQMVEEILDLTKLEHNKSEPVYEIKEVAPLVKRIVYAFETLIEKEDLELEYNDDRAKGLYLSMDTGKFEKVMNNLMYNAIKFNKEGGRIVVSLYPNEDGRQLCIDVTDSGIGIADADLPHIFEHFYQGETKGAKAAGAGIGLSLVKEFTMLMGGTVHVASRQGEGTSFTLLHDLATPPVAANAVLPEEVTAGSVEAWNPFASRQKVLIVEDNTEMRYYLQEVLGEYVDITVAGNGNEGIASLEQIMPDLIISDVMMPDMDGWEFVNYLKAQDRFRKIPVVTLTALADMETQLSFLRLGVDDYIVKPFDAEELRIRVYNLLMNQAERRAFNKEPAEADDVATDSKEAEEFRGKVTAYVLARIKNINVSVTDLAYELALSERQLYRLSKNLTGYSPAQLIKEVRLQKAYELLLSGNIYKVDDVCRRVGYEKASYLAQQFYERFGKRPSEFL